MPLTIFSPAQLDALVSTTLKDAALPAGHRNAIVGAVNQHGVQVVAGFTRGAQDQWKVSGAFVHDWDGTNSVGASVLYSF